MARNKQLRAEPEPPAGAAESLQERRDRAGRVELDDPVQVTHVDAQFQGAGGHDDAVARLGECLLGAAALVGRQRGVRQERGYARWRASSSPSSSTSLRDSQKTNRFSPACSDAITVAALSTEPT